MKLIYGVIHHFQNTDDYFCTRRYSVVFSAAIQQCVRCLLCVKHMYHAKNSIFCIITVFHNICCFGFSLLQMLCSQCKYGTDCPMLLYSNGQLIAFFKLQILFQYVQNILYHTVLFVCRFHSLCMEKLSVVIHTHVLQAGLKRSYVKSCFNGC